MEPAPPPDRISDLYHRALACTPEERSAFLNEECKGDEALRGELQYEAGSARFLETPAAVVASDLSQAADRSQMIGRQLGPYTLVAPLGSGGMGEVYRAPDSRLGRDVAIKIPPAHFTTDPERRARFGREARLLATLNSKQPGYSRQLWLRMTLARTLNGDSPCGDASRFSSPSRASFSPILRARRG